MHEHLSKGAEKYHETEHIVLILKAKASVVNGLGKLIFLDLRIFSITSDASIPTIHTIH